MNETGYWTRFAARRQTRRRVLAGGLALGASTAALALAGCGRDGGGTQEGGLISTLRDRSREAVVGGTLNHTQLNAPNLDANVSPATLTRFGISMLYTRLFKVMPGVNEPASGEKVGDSVESWEFTENGTRLTLKIRPNLGSDPRPPLNGRNLDATDVLASWNRWAEKSTLRSDLVNAINPDGPVQSVTAPDRNTVVFRLAFPSIVLMDYLTDGFYFWVMPKEAEGGFDPQNAAHGAGPYYLDDFLSGVHYRMTRNPNYYDKPLPYYEKMNWFVVPEPAAQLAQFEAKNLDLGAGINARNVVEVKKRHPEMLLYSMPVTGVAATSRFGFAPGEPFHDVRVRRAISMAYDRSALEEYFTNKNHLESQGLPVTPKWASHLSAMWAISGNPADEKSFGPNAQYFAHNPAESRKLLAAAGRERLTFDYHMDNFSRDNLQDGELLAGQLRDSGIGVTVNQKVQEYASWFLPQIYRGRGNWSGMAHGAVGYKFSPESFIYSYFHPAPGTAHYPQGLFPDLVNRINAILKEFDNKKRETMVKDFEKAAAAEMPCLPLGSSSPPYTLAWPWVAQAGVLTQWPGDGVAVRNTLYSRYWFDAKKAQELGRPS